MLAAAAAFLLRNLVTLLTLAVALRTRPADLRATWARRRLVARALVVLELGVPALALLVTGLLPLRAATAGAIALMAACPGSPVVLRSLRGHAEILVIIAALSLLAPLTLPLWLWAINRALPLELAAATWPVVRIVLAQVAVPLVAGLAMAALAPRLADLFGRILFWLFLLGFVAAAALVVYRGAPALLQASPWALLAVALVAWGAALMGQWAGRPSLDEGRALAWVAVLGNPALALAVASHSYPGPRVATLMAAYLVLRALALLGYEILLRLRLRPRGSDAFRKGRREQPVG